MKTLRLLIVDDEPLIRAEIRSALVRIADLAVIGEAGSAQEALAATLNLQPDLLLLDVQLQDATGFDVLRQMPLDRIPAVIFLTAYDEYAVRAFRHNAVDYVLKPFDPRQLAVSIVRARERIASSHQAALAEQLQNLLTSQQPPRFADRLIVKNGERYDVVPTDAIDWIESANNYVCLHCGPKNYLLGETLTSLEARLNPAKFARIHRRRIVNLARVLAVHPLFGGVYEMELRNGTRLGTGRQFKSAIEVFLQG